LFIKDIYATVTAAAGRCQRADRAAEVPADGILPRKAGRGRQSEEKRTAYEEDMARFAATLKEIDSRLDFKVSSRGWCYFLENEHGLSKGDFAAAQDRITECRKNGLLPIDFTAEDEARSADNLEELHDPSPAVHAAALAALLLKWKEYTPVSFWDFQKVFIQTLVEKIDLKNLFLPVCQEYHVPIINARGWSDLNLRAALMRRFQEHERAGRTGVLLLGGDHDPGGLQMSDLQRKNLWDLAVAVGWQPTEEKLIIDRFGLNADFIDKNHLTWIEGLTTSSGGDLGDPRHPMHNSAFVQDYIAKYGKRKVEANALVVRPEAGRQLCRQAILKYLDPKGIAAYKRALAKQRALLKAALPPAVKKVLEEIKRGGR
jgi:hypothetical protein